MKNFVIGFTGFVNRLAMKFAADCIPGYDVKYSPSLPLCNLWTDPIENLEFF